jgi:integrase
MIDTASRMVNDFGLPSPERVSEIAGRVIAIREVGRIDRGESAQNQIKPKTLPILGALSVLLSRKEQERMARREYQNPPLKIGGTGRKFYYIRVRKRVLTGDGKLGRTQPRITLGWCDEVGRREAERRRADKLREINGELYTIQSHIGFKDFVEIYRDRHMPELGEATKKKYTLQIANHILPAFGEMKLCDVDTECIKAWLQGKEKDGLSWWTRTDLRNILSSIFTEADTLGYWKERNPVERVTCGRKREVREKRLLSDDQTRALLSELSPQLNLIVETAISTGLRTSELLGLRWKDIDLDRGILKVQQRYYRGDVDIPKSARSRRIEALGLLTSDFRILSKEKDPDAYVFVRNDGSGEPLWDSGIRKALKNAAAVVNCDFPGFGMHSFRRANFTRLQEEGASSIEAQRIGGHSTAAMTAEYTLVQDTRRDELVRKLQVRMRGLRVIPKREKKSA